MTSVGYIEKTFPEMERIKDAVLRRQTAQVWVEAMKRGGWETLDNIPFTLLAGEVSETLVAHTRMVTRQAIAVAETRGDLRMDLVIAGALLHDVGKLLEFTRQGGVVVKSPHGRILRHPVSGAGLAMIVGMPDEMVHIIAAHSKEGEMVERIPEAVLIHHCDFIDFEIVKARKGSR
ncbi:MAG: HDIG domain-containing metalloprotein [Candidatus Thermoplasmatota archaeon]